MVEIVAGRFRPQVLQGTVGTDTGKGHFHFQLAGRGRVEIEISDNLPSAYIGEVLFHIKFAITTAVVHFRLFIASVMDNGFGKRHGEIGIVGTCPAVRYAVAGDEGIVFYTDVCPQHFAVVVVNAVYHIQDNTLVLAVLREGVFMDSYPLGGCQLGFYPIIGEHHFVITGTGNLRIV